MLIPVSCPSCSVRFKAPEKFAGRKVKCPQCQAPVLIPIPEPEFAEIVEDDRTFRHPTKRQVQPAVALKRWSMDWWMTPLFHVRGIPASPFAIAMILFIFFSCVSLIGGRFKKKEEKTANSQVEGRRAKQQVDAAAKKEAEAAKRAESERRNKELAAKRQEEQEKQEREASTTKHLVLQNPEQDNKKNTGVVVAVSEEVMILYAQCVVAKVPDGIIKLANAGMTWIVDYPTEVTVITHGDAISKVRINSGPSRGKDAWVGTEWIKEIKEK